MNNLFKTSLPFPTAFKAGLLSTLFCCLIYFVIDRNWPDLFAASDNLVRDTMFSIRGPQNSSGSVVIIDIDDSSLEKNGQWPWPRNLVAKLTDKILEAGPKAVGFDLMFSERDSCSPLVFLENSFPLLKTLSEGSKKELQRLADKISNSDRNLGRVFADPRIIQGYRFLFQEDFKKGKDNTPAATATLQLDSLDKSFAKIQLTSAYRPILNWGELRTGGSEGFINLLHDRQGTVRKAPLFLLMDNIPYPSLGVEMVMRGTKTNNPMAHIGSAEKDKYLPVKAISFNNHLFPTDPYGQIDINFRGPSNTFLYLSATDVMSGSNSSFLNGKYVIIGSTASGTIDLITTPYSSRMPGVEVHANIVDNLLQKDSLVRNDRQQALFSYATLLAGGVFLSSVVVFLHPFIGLVLSALLLTAVCAANYYLFFLSNTIIDISLVVLLIFMIFLTVSTSGYIFEGKRRSFIKRAFVHYVSPGVVNELVRHPEKLDLLVDEREVTVLFCDIREFTSLAEKVSPAELSDFLNSYFSLLTEIIIEHRGMVDKYIGDGIMAVWGTPLENIHHREHAVQAALEMVAAVANNSRSLMLAGRKISIGIGMNSGLVSAGNFGCKNRFDYTVLGDTVNLASRIESITKHYPVHILTSQFTMKNGMKEQPGRFIDRVLVKGRHDTVDLYEPLSSVKEMSLSSAETNRYQEAFKQYSLGNFEQAFDLFNDLFQQTADPLYKFHLERCEKLLNKAPGANWDGIHKFG